MQVRKGGAGGVSSWDPRLAFPKTSLGGELLPGWVMILSDVGGLLTYLCGWLCILDFFEPLNSWDLLATSRMTTNRGFTSANRDPCNALSTSGRLVSDNV